MQFKIDLIIFGATGFTGKYLVEECSTMALNGLTWGIAGRNKEKMKNLLEKVSLKTDVDVTNVLQIIADCEDEESLKKMASLAKVVINCCGPYRFYGEQVVKACIEMETHYVDVCGEPEFMDKTQLMYHDLAKAKNSYIISSCGLDSIPVDLGVIHLMKNFDGQVNFIESYMKISTNTDSYAPICNATTWESAVYGYSNAKNLIDIRKQLFSKTRIVKPQPSIPKRPAVHRCPEFDYKRSIAFPGADKSVVVRSQMFLANEYKIRPVQFNAYMICNSYPILLAMFVVGYFLQTLTKYSFGRSLLLRFPEYFSLGMMSRTGPSEEIAEKTTGTYKFIGEGWSKQFLETVVDPNTVTAPTDMTMITTLEIKNPSYGFTAISAVLSALTILRETELLPSSGGVYAPGAAFYNTNFIENLSKRGINYKIVKKHKKVPT